MNFKKAIKWLYSFQKFGIKLGLERITYIMEKLGNPQNSYKTIHVGGTNGKGSVCKYLESILTLNGYTIGLYTSPHLQIITERITIGTKKISKSELLCLIEKIKPIIKEMPEDDKPTFFELFTAIAFMYFKEKNVDFAIIEVGLGGRYDATNIITPELSIITNVTLEHQNILGLTIEQIANEKSGIIKHNIPTITAAAGNALNIIKKNSKEKKSQLTILSDKNWTRVNNTIKKQEFHIKGLLNNYNVSTKIKGAYQGENITLCLIALETLQFNGLYVADYCISKGIDNTINPGRMQLISCNPYILLDGAHNPMGMNKLSDTLKYDFEYKKLIVVLSILSDKNIVEMLSKISPITDFFIVTRNKNERACNPKELIKIIKNSNYNNKIVVKLSVKEAIDYAKKISKPEDMICITGSLFTVGEALDFFNL